MQTYSVTTYPPPWSVSACVWQIRLTRDSNWFTYFLPGLLACCCLWTLSEWRYATWDNSKFFTEVETFPTWARVFAAHGETAFPLGFICIHATSKFHFTLHLKSKEHDLTAHSATVGQHSHFVTIDKTNNLFWALRQSNGQKKRKGKKAEWGTADPAAPGSRAITECFGQAAEIAATPLHSLTLSALHWLGTWARLIRSNLWQRSTHSLSSKCF